MISESILTELSSLCLINNELIERINNALSSINGTKHLPLWMEKAFNGPLSSISADSLQGIKVCLRHQNDILNNYIAEHRKYLGEEK